MNAKPLPQRLPEPEAAKYIGMSTSWLSKSRLPGRNEDTPPHLKIGRRVVYDTVDLDAWLAAHRVNVSRPVEGAL